MFGGMSARNTYNFLGVLKILRNCLLFELRITSIIGKRINNFANLDFSILII
jgi:hypothetical protein